MLTDKIESLSVAGKVPPEFLSNSEQTTDIFASELVIFDPRVEKLDHLVAGLRDCTHYTILAESLDPLLQIEKLLTEYTSLDVVHIVSHGQPGSLLIGDAIVDDDYLDKHTSQLEDVRAALPCNVRFVLYGCEVGKGQKGKDFVQRVESCLGATVVATDTLTGNPARGGDWNFNVSASGVAVEIAFTDALVNEYTGIFDPVVSISDAELVEGDGGSAGYKVIEFVVSLSEAATTDVLIDYQTINGTTQEEVDFFQKDGTLTIASGDTSGIITVTVASGNDSEKDEFFVVELTNPWGAVFADEAVSLRAAGTILDNDGADPKLALFVDDVRVLEGDAGSREAVFLVRLSQDPDSAVTLNYTTTDGSAVGGIDYVPQAGSLTFVPGGDLVQELRVDLLGDTDVELAETFNLTFSPSEAITNGTSGLSGTATILDDDAGADVLPVVSIESAELVEGDGGSAGYRVIEFVVTLSEPSDADVILDYQTINRGAKEDEDFFQKSGELTIPSGDTSGIITVTVSSGNISELDESLALELSNAQGAVFAGGALSVQAQGVILDTDGSGTKLALLVSDAEVLEGDSGSSNAVFEVRLSQPAEEDITLSYVTQSATALAGEDFTARSGTLTFLAGETVKAVAIPVLGDSTVEGSEQFSLILTPTAAIANGVQEAEGVATILDDDAGGGFLPTLSIESAEMVEGDGGSAGYRTMEFVVRLSEAAATDVFVDYQTINGTAIEDVDFFQKVDTLSIAAGDATGIITVRLTSGNVSEADESFALELSNVQGAVFAGNALSLQTQGVILDTDGTGDKRALIVSDAEVVEGNSGSREAVFEVRLSQPADETVSVHYTTAPGSATTGSDFEPVTGTLVFLPGQTLAAVHVPVIGDTDVESSEQFSLILSAPEGGAFGAGGAGAEGTATILDDDAGSASEPVISIADVNVVEGDGGTAGQRTMEYVVSLSAPSSTAISVDYTTVEGTALAGSDYNAKSGTLTFAAGQTKQIVEVTVLAGDVEEPDENLFLRLSNPINAALAGNVSELDGEGTIIDNDSPEPFAGLPLLVVDDIEVMEQVGGNVAVFTLSLSSPSGIEVNGSFTIGAGTAIEGADFTGSEGSFSIPAGSTSVTLEVPILDDLLVEPVETFVLHITDLNNARYHGADETLWAIGDILDNDEYPMVTVAAGPDETLNEGDTLTRTMTFSDGEDSGENGWTYAVDWDGDGIADESGAIAPGSTSFDVSHVFTDGDDVKTVTVTVEDGEGESDSESFDVTVLNVAPQAGVTGADSTDEGDVFTLNVGEVMDPGADTVAAYEIDWGDGSVDVFTPEEWAAALGSFAHTYADGDSVYGIEVSVTDEDGTFIVGSHEVAVNNLAPSVELSGIDDIDEGDVYALVISGSDPAGAADTLAYEIDWGDGSATETVTAEELATLGGVVEHQYTDDEDGLVNATDRLITVTVSDEDGGSGVATRTVTVNNVAPVAMLTGAAAVELGSTYALSIGFVTDPGNDTVTEYRVDWGDGSEDTYTTAELSALGGSVEHAFSTLGDKLITVSGVDEDGEFVFGDVALTVDALPDTVSVAVGGSEELNEGDTLTRTMTFSDGEDSGEDGWTYAVDWDGDGIADESGAIAPGSTSFDVSHVFTDGDDVKTVTVTVEDGEGESDSESFDVTVLNVAPQAEVTGADSTDEGDVFTLNVGEVMDPGEDTVAAYEIDWGDGSVDVFTPEEWAAALGSFAHTYADGDSVYGIEVSVTDEDGTFLVRSHELTVNEVDDINPVIGTSGSDSLEGTDASDLVMGLGGFYDRLSGGLSADIFYFGEESSNGVRERNVITDFVVGEDVIHLLEDDYTVSFSSTAAILQIGSDSDLVYVLGSGLTEEDLGIQVVADGYLF